MQTHFPDLKGQSKQTLSAWVFLRKAFSIIELPVDGVPENVTEMLASYQEYMDQDRPQLLEALDVLERLGQSIPCRGGYWRNLERAAEMLNRKRRISYYQEQFRLALLRSSRQGR